MAVMKGKRIPMIGRIEMIIIEEANPRLLAFIKGELDISNPVPPDLILNVLDASNKLKPDLARKGIVLARGILPTISFVYFNMEDPVVGGYTPDKGEAVLDGVDGATGGTGNTTGCTRELLQTTLDAGNATRPMLAAKAAASEDFKTYTFELRKGVKFHNGQEMTSADVKASFERFRRVSPAAKNLEAIDHFETPDPYSFVIALKEPNVVLLDIIKSPIYPLMILPASQKDKPARDIEVIGTGPYKLGEWVKDSHLVITRFDDYVADTSAPGRDGYGGRKTVYLDGVRYRFMPEATTRIAALQNGEAQLISSVPSELSARVTQRKDLAIREVFPVLGSYIIVNSQKGLTANVLIRQAIAAAINVDDIIADLEQGLAAA